MEDGLGDMEGSGEGARRVTKGRGGIKNIEERCCNWRVLGKPEIGS